MNQKDMFNFEGNIRKIKREPLTPYKIAVVGLIKIFCNDKRKDIAERRDFCIASLKLIQSADMKLEQLLDLFFSDEYMLLRFVRELKELLNAIHTEDVEKLLDLFESLRRLMKPAPEHPLAPPMLHKNSVLGLYIRRMIVLFESLTFDDLIILYEDFQAYVKEWEDDAGTSTSKSLLDSCSYYKSRNAWAGRHAELAIAQQAHALQTDEHKALPPKKLQSLIKDLIHCSPYNSEAHYLSYLNSLRVNEYCGAIDSLYHCFDTLAPLENRSSPEDKSQMFRFAALNLASLHVQFGHKEVAQAALKEAIMMAQEAGDNVCLQLANAWMYNLTNEKKGSLIERSIGKATSLGITPTQSLGFIASAHNAAMEAKNPQVIFETLINSDLLNCQNSMLDLISVTYVERAALWAYYGKTEMSSVCSQLLLLYNSGDKKQYMFNGPSTCQAVVNIANILVEFGEYQQANLCLNHAKQRFPNEPSNKIWMLSERLFEFTKLMRHEKWSDAAVIAKEIANLDPLESLFRQVDVCIAKGDYPTAIKLVEKIKSYPNITAQNKVRSMIMSSQIDCSSILPGIGVAGCNSLIDLNSALELAAVNHLSYYGALIKMHIANIQLLLKMPNHASKIVNEAIVEILAHGGLFDQGRAFVLHAKCLMATASEISTDRKNKMLLEAVKALTKARVAFDKVEAFGRVKSTLYLLCIAYNELNMKIQRNQCAFEYRKLDQQFVSKFDKMSLY